MCSAGIQSSRAEGAIVVGPPRAGGDIFFDTAPDEAQQQVPPATCSLKTRGHMDVPANHCHSAQWNQHTCCWSLKPTGIVQADAQYHPAQAAFAQWAHEQGSQVAQGTAGSYIQARGARQGDVAGSFDHLQNKQEKQEQPYTQLRHKARHHGTHTSNRKKRMKGLTHWDKGFGYNTLPHKGWK